MTLRLATRSSALALWQAETTRALLQTAFRDLEVELVHVSSSGDRNQTEALARFGRIGIFTAEVDSAVLDGHADAAVHSLKDLTTTLQEGMALRGVLPRGPVEDALVTPGGSGTLDTLAPGARVATGSLRRAASVRAVRGDLEIVEVRGNVDTRLGKLDRGDAEALILARAGLVRLGFEQRIVEVLDTQRFLPAVGQGIVGLTCREDDDATAQRLRAISDMEAWDEAQAERALLAELRGGCNVPAGAHARAVENGISVRARVLSLDGTEVIEGRRGGPRDAAAQLGIELASELLERGAQRLIDQARG